MAQVQGPGPDHFDFIVIGVGHFGYRVGRLLLGANPWASILFVNEEPDPPYTRKMVNHTFEPFDPEKYRFRSIWTTPRTQLRTGVTAVGIDRVERVVHFSDGHEAHYNTLFLGPGATPRGIEAPGADLPGVSHMWSLDDAIGVSSSISSFRTAMVIGTGILGMDMTVELLRLGKRVTVVARKDAIMSNRFNSTTSEMIRSALAEQGVTLLCNETIRSIARKSDRLEVTLKGSTHLVDRVLIAIGVVPRIDLAVSAGLATRTGILVDEHLRTSDPHIYCGGDAAEFPDGEITQKEAAASHQAEVAVLDVLGIPASYRPQKYRLGFALGSRHFHTQNKPDDGTPGVEEIDRHVEDGYEAFYFRDGVLVGATLALNHPTNDRYADLVNARPPRELALKILRISSTARAAASPEAASPEAASTSRDQPAESMVLSAHGSR